MDKISSWVTFEILKIDFSTLSGLFFSPFLIGNSALSGSKILFLSHLSVSKHLTVSHYASLLYYLSAVSSAL